MADLLKKLRNFVNEGEKLKWEGTVQEYIELLEEKPHLHIGAHERVLNMILSHGVERNEDGDITKYNFFENDLFGVNEPLEDIMAYLRAAAAGSEVGRRILLLYGPTSSGKSQLAILLKRGLERYSKTDEGAIYRLADSPMHEDPLVVIPHELRDAVEEKLGLKIIGEPSPLTAKILEETYNGNFLDMKVERYFVSEKNRDSIGTFVPGAPKDQDLSELVGSLDLSKIGDYGVESDPRAYSFDGELNVANRGMMEFVELLKTDSKFLYVLLTLAQEKNIKTARFPLIWADEFVLSHTNETEYKRFLAKDEMEALHDRIIVVRFPYNLCLNEEIKIYEKLIGQANFKNIHIAPHTLFCAAMFGVMSRLFDSNNQSLNLIGKMRLYNGEEVEGFTAAEASKFKNEFEEEGMMGVSPRYIINRIASQLAEDNMDTITPIDIVRSLKSGLKTNPKLDKKERGRLEGLLLYVIEEYEKLAKNDVQKAFFVNFSHEIANLLKNYMDQIEGYLDGTKLENEWGEMVEPDEKLMRSIEEKVGVTESGKKSFRQEIFRKMLRSNCDYSQHSKLKEALEKQLFDERQDIIRLTVSARNPDEEELKKINVVVNTLCEKYGYNAKSANQLLKYVNSLMARK